MPRTSLTLLFILPALLLALATFLFHRFPWDIDWTSPFYQAAHPSWPLNDAQPWSALYHYGYLPAWAVAISALLILLLGFWSTRLARFRKLSVYFILVLIIGPGIIINAVLKDHWGRPRPRDTKPFGGEFAFEKILTIDPSSPGKSFPSGHASMGFYFISFAFLCAHFAKKTFAALAALFGVLYGSIMGVARIVQGGHFPSDVLYAGALVFFTAAALYFLLGLHRHPLN